MNEENKARNIQYPSRFICCPLQEAVSKVPFRVAAALRDMLRYAHLPHLA
jgi:hypothetical protein